MGRVEVAIERTAERGERIVALTRLLPESAQDPRRKEMFLREASLAALLAHPNVVHAYESGEIDGELFIAMEYVEGEPLSRVLAAARRESHRLAPALVAHVLAEACDGLHAAHELRDGDGRALKLVHRDVSPHNVMIAYAGQVKLLDFGVAKLDGAAQATRTGEVKGKMAYMSPEQALGEKLDRRSDLFGVGAVLYECLTGSPLWGQGTDVDIMRRLALEAPPRLEETAPDAPSELARLYTRLVARSPADRPATAAEVASALRAFAASAVAPPSAPSVKELMTRLFGADAAGRRKELEEHLARAAPTNVEELRKSLEPGKVASGGDARGAMGSRMQRGKGRPWGRRVALAAAACRGGDRGEEDAGRDGRRERRRRRPRSPTPTPAPTPTPDP